MSSTDCFIVSQLISVARHAGRFKLGLKPTQLYVRLSIILLSHQSAYVSSGIIRHYVVAFACLHFALPECSIHMKSFAFSYNGRFYSTLIISKYLMTTGPLYLTESS